MPSKNTHAALRAKTAKVLELPRSAQALIAHYCKLQIMGTHCVCPYHINCGLASRNRALRGKGRPVEIEAAAEHFFKRFNTTIKPGDSAKLKSSLRDHGIGIDCSGFAAWVLNELTLRRLGKPVWKCLKFASARSRVVSKLRPVENISAALLTGDHNTKHIKDLRDIRPGDLIRALRGGHVIVVTEVGLNDSAHATYFCYAHSTAYSETVNGLSEGLVVVRKPAKDLTDQQWIEADMAEAPALFLVKAGAEDSRVVRLKALS